MWNIEFSELNYNSLQKLTLVSKSKSQLCFQFVAKRYNVGLYLITTMVSYFVTKYKMLKADDQTTDSEFGIFSG